MIKVYQFTPEVTMSDSGLEKFILDKLEKLDDKLDQVRVDNAKINEAVIAHEKRDQEIHKDVLEMSRTMANEIAKQNASLNIYNDHLKDHMRRTELLEKSHANLRERAEPVIQAYESEKTVDKYISDKWAKRLKILGGISVALGIIVTLVQIFTP
jgi:hypothetical protein